MPLYAFKGEAKTMGDDPTAYVIDGGADDHTVHVQPFKRMVNEDKARSRHDAPTLHVLGYPVADLATPVTRTSASDTNGADYFAFVDHKQNVIGCILG